MLPHAVSRNTDNFELYTFFNLHFEILQTEGGGDSKSTAVGAAAVMGRDIKSLPSRHRIIFILLQCPHTILFDENAATAAFALNRSYPCA